MLATELREIDTLIRFAELQELRKDFLGLRCAVLSIGRIRDHIASAAAGRLDPLLVGLQIFYRNP